LAWGSDPLVAALCQGSERHSGVEWIGGGVPGIPDFPTKVRIFNNLGVQGPWTVLDGVSLRRTRRSRSVSRSKPATFL